MATVVRMPEVLANTSEAIIQTWLVSVGQEINVGDPIAEIETEKAVVEYAAEVAGVLAQLIAEPGVTIAVGEPIAVVGAPGETVDANTGTDTDTDAPRDPESAAPILEAPAPQPVQAATAQGAPATNGRRLFATPLVRKIAKEKGIDLHSVAGTGPGGRIVRRDLEKLPAATAEPTPAATPAPAPAPRAEAAPATGFTDIPLTGMRKAIARRLTESKTTVPHFYVTVDCRVDALLELRKTVNAASPV
jgi:pyruvate dehydrogenase E2 component (dihydrolipoamide acetyltransferase)